jgi:hypothetical protein
MSLDNGDDRGTLGVSKPGLASPRERLHPLHGGSNDPLLAGTQLIADANAFALNFPALLARKFGLRFDAFWQMITHGCSPNAVKG